MTKRILKVAWTESAARELKEIVSYVAADSAPNAQKILEKLRKKARSLEVMPERGRTLPELLHFGIRIYRELIVRPYRIIYRIEGNIVYVMSVLDARRDIENLLLERLLDSKGSRENKFPV